MNQVPVGAVVSLEHCAQIKKTKVSPQPAVLGRHSLLSHSFPVN